MTPDEAKAFLEKATDQVRRYGCLTLPQTFDKLDAMAAELNRLREFALKALTVCDWAAEVGYALDKPHFDPADVAMEGFAIFNVDNSADARALLETVAQTKKEPASR